MDSSTSTRQSNFFYRWLSMCCYKTPPPRTMSMSEENKAKWKEFGYRSTGSTLPPIFALLIDLYDGKDVLDGLESCRINPDLLPNHHIRNDLEYYIPQLTNFMVYHEDFLCQKLIMFLEGASRADPYFAHCYYWYINSLATQMDQTKTQNILSFVIQECSTDKQTQLFLPFYQRFRLGLQRKLKTEEYEAKIKEMNERSAKAALVIQSYKADDLNLNMPDFQIKASDLELKLYQTTYVKEENVFPPNPFTSTLLFLEDLYCIAESITKEDDKLSYLKTLLHDVNKALPACVYIPFVKDSIRYYSILNIVVEESKVFSTKERSPFYLCMEIFRPQEELAYEYNDLFHLEDAEELAKKKEKKKKSKKILDWAKKTFNLNKKHREEEEEERSNSKRNTLFLQREPDEQFKLSKLTENISSPMTVKRVFRSQEGPELLGPRPKAASTQSLILHSHHENFTEFMVQTEETKEYKTPTPEKSELYTIPHQLGRMRKKTNDRNDLENDVDSTTGNGIAAIYQDDESQSDSIISSSNSKGSFLRKSFKDSITPQKPEGKTISESLQEPLIEDRKEDEDSDGGSEKERGRIPSLVLSQEEVLDFFGEDSSEEAERIKRDSPFRFLKSWKLVHLIVKSGADMKEEQFAVQLISQFDQIFKLEKTKLILTPYEIVSLGSDFGIVEMVKDILTMSRLKEKMKKHNIFTLNEFFVKYYGAEVDKARKRFCRSLAAYSVVCYFLQIKDRHNGNILFHKLGHILHIDFGFFLTNAPGKGLEFEKKVHFKLLNEHVEVLGGPRSRLFQYFRKLFYRGFMAARKHKEQILILVKMMYSTQGSNLPCFKGGIRAITELEQRFEPQGVEEGDLTGYCYNLINQSLDNWRAKCYDKYQYHFQGIFY